MNDKRVKDGVAVNEVERGGGVAAERLRLLEAALAAGGEGVIIVDVEGRLISINEAGRRISGRPQPPGAPAAGMLPIRYPDGRPIPPADTPLSRALRGEEVRHFLLVLTPPSGEEAYVENTASPVRDERGQLMGAVAILHDVTEEHRAEETLRERERETLSLLDHMPDIITRLDRDMRYTFVSEGVRRTTGVPPETYLGQTPRETGLFDEATLAASEHYSQRAFATGEVQTFEHPVKQPWGTLYYLVRIIPEFDAEGHVVSLLNVSQEVTERKRAEAERERLLADAQQARLEAEQASQRLATILESISDAFVALDAEARFTYVNRKAAAIWGFDRENLIGRSLWEVFPEFVGTEMSQAYEQVASQGEPVDLEYYYAPSDLWLQIRGYPADGGLSVYFADITPRKRAEAEREALLRQVREVNERLVAGSLRERNLAEEARRRAAQAEEALRLRDEFLSLAAHELKTPLTSLKGYAELSMRRMEREGLQEPERIFHALEAINHQADRFSALVVQILDTQRIEAGELKLERQPTDLVPLIRRVVAGVQAGTSKHTLSLHAPPSLEADVDPVRLEQVLYNLLDNAIRYSPHGGPVDIDLSAPSGNTARIAVRDYGIGIPPEQREQLFTRFFQVSRRPAGGLGLGLYTSRRVIELHGGHIWAEFPEDGGSRFVVELPRDGDEGTHGN